MSGFEGWYAHAQPATHAVEQIVYSKKHKYIGTFDSILSMNNTMYLCDLKTTNASREAPQGVYADNFIQLGAYYTAYEEMRAARDMILPPIDDLMILSCRKDGSVDMVTAASLGLSLEDCRDAWLGTLKVHNFLQKAKQKIGERT